MSSFQERKKARKEYYEKFVKNKKLITCIACNGSGYYDRKNSPKCAVCQGLGKVREL